MITVFYGSQVYEQYINPKVMWKFLKPDDPIYQEGYFMITGPGIVSDLSWFHIDGTPCLIEDVPKQLQMLALVLNL